MSKNLTLSRKRSEWLIPRHACPVCRKPFKEDEELGLVADCDCGGRGQMDVEFSSGASFRRKRRDARPENKKKGAFHAEHGLPIVRAARTRQRCRANNV
jgi:hypothetical protein